MCQYVTSSVWPGPLLIFLYLALTEKTLDTPAVDIPVLTEAARQELHSNFTLEEIKTAIRSFSSGKACGPDGFGIEFYKNHIDIIAPLLLRVVNCSVELGTFPHTLYDAHICVLLKKDRDETNVASYQPLSLLNSDQKNNCKSPDEPIKQIYRLTNSP